MRTQSVEIGGLTLELGLTFGALAEVTQKVADPLVIVREAGKAAALASAGVFNYQPRFEWTLASVALVIWAGAKATNKAIKLEEVQEACCEAGFAEALAIADAYIAAAISGGPAKSEAAPSSGE